MKLLKLTVMGFAFFSLFSCFAAKKQYASYADYPVRTDNLVEMVYSPRQTAFTLWAPTADAVRLRLYEAGEGGKPLETLKMQAADNGCWTLRLEGDCKGRFYTFQVKYKGKWLDETPGINARAVGVNGQRAAILDMTQTNPDRWEADVRPEFHNVSDAVIYEMHHRDFSVSPSSGISWKGKFLALAEAGCRSDEGRRTGIGHLQELGVTHVHLLPSYDFASIDESRLEQNKYNWGYDPLNYNVPEGSYSTNPYRPEVRIREFKEMVQALHRAGIRVVLDVVYNHVFDRATSNFERTVPGYFFRDKPDGTAANASGCGNETASERAMMRRYMVESVKYWMEEYHIDGFRFDLMGIHDLETMNEIRQAATAIDPAVLLYGEGWAAETPVLPADRQAMKANIGRLPGFAAFSDELRDALRGPFSDDRKAAFLAGLPGEEESVKFGIAGAIAHPGVDCSKVNYSQKPWATQPSQMISYVSCHDDMCLVDRLKASIPGIDDDALVRLDKLAQTAVFVSQGIPFIQAGEEVLRNKKGVHNSFCSPDDVNAIDWRGKARHSDVFDYYRGLIALRKAHPAFRMGSADLVRSHLHFLPAPQACVVAFRLDGQAVGDSWKHTYIVLNAGKTAVSLAVPEANYTIVCRDGRIDLEGLAETTTDVLTVAPQTALIVHD